MKTAARKKGLPGLLETRGRRAKREVSEHFKAKDPGKWDRFILNTVDSPKFIKSLQRSKQSDAKLVLHAVSMRNLQKGTIAGEVDSAGKSGGKYQIKNLPGGLGCTCGDWRYKGSVRPGYECKHIRAFKEGKMKIAALGPQMGAFFDEMSKMRQAKKMHAESSKRDQYDDNDRPFSNLLTQDEEPSYYNPHPAQPVDEPEIILGGAG